MKDIKLTNGEKEIIKRALLKLKEEFKDNKRYYERQNYNHKEMIDLLDGNNNNELAKAKLKYEEKRLKDNENSIKSFSTFIIKTDLLIDKIDSI